MIGVITAPFTACLVGVKGRKAKAAYLRSDGEGCRLRTTYIYEAKNATKMAIIAVNINSLLILSLLLSISHSKNIK